MKKFYIFLYTIVLLYSGYRVGVSLSGQNIHETLVLTQGLIRLGNLETHLDIKEEIAMGCFDSANARLESLIDTETEILHTFLHSSGVDALNVKITQSKKAAKVIENYSVSKSSWKIPPCYEKQNF